MQIRSVSRQFTLRGGNYILETDTQMSHTLPTETLEEAQKGGMYKCACAPHVCMLNMREHQRGSRTGSRKKQTDGNRVGKKEAQKTKSNGAAEMGCVYMYGGGRVDNLLW